MPEQTDDCVESVLEENPSYSESRAYAICKAQQLVGDPNEVASAPDLGLDTQTLDTLVNETNDWERVAAPRTSIWVDRESASAVYQQEVPDDAVSISDRDEAPEDAQVITGPRGGLYYVSDSDSGDSSGGGDSRPRSEIQEEIQDAVDSGDVTAVSETIGDAFGVETVELPRNMPDDQLVEFSTSLTHAAETGIGSTVERVHSHSGRDASGFYRYNDGTLSFNNDINEENFEEYVENGDAVGDSVEWLALHELGHAEHDTTVDDMVNSEEFFDQGLSVSRDGEWVGRERVDLVDEEVSSYARTNPSEFVAEVYAGLALGQEFSDDVMEIYEEFSGPDSWQDYRGEQE